MSSADSARRKLEELRKKRADAAKHEAEARKKQAAAETKVADYNVKAARASSPSTAKTYARQAESALKVSLAAGKKVAEWSNKAAGLAKQEADAYKQLDQAMQREGAEAERARKRQAGREDQERKRREEVERRAREAERRQERGLTDAMLSSTEHRLSSQIERLRPPHRERLRILYVTATPEGGLRLDKEMRRVYKGVQAATERDLVDIRPLPAATPSDFLDAMSGFKPHVVHFSGHADRTGLTFDTDYDHDNDGHDIDAALFARAIRSVDRPPLLVVMNACESEGHLDGLLEVVPMAIGMADEIGDPDAMSFAARFYTSIADGQSVASAFGAAVVQMEMDGMDDADLPVLRTRDGVDAGEQPLVIPAESEGGAAAK